MTDVVVSEFMDEAALSSELSTYDVLYDPKLVDRPEDLKEALSTARAIIVRNRTQVNQALLDSAPNLKAVGRLGVGLDNIDLDACKKRGVAVFPANGANDASVAEYVIAASMVLLRGAWLGTDQVANGEWPRTQMMGREVAGKTLGLIGYGAIARETAQRARDLGMTIIAFDPYLDAQDPLWGETRNVDMDALLSQSDVISLHVPLTDSTRHMIDAKALSTMKKDSILINAARGGVVDEDALVAAMKAGTISGAALDVFEQEPLNAENGAKFKGLSNLILTPHIAGVTDESNVRVSLVTAQSVRKHLESLG